MQWISRREEPTWRRHPWVFLLWLLAGAAMIASLSSIFTSGPHSRALSGFLTLACGLGLIQDIAVRCYERGKEPAASQQAAPTQTQ
jgi:hypothetical protein